MAKYWLKYSKGEAIRFISHLDILRAFERSFRRGNIPVEYTQGFNKRPRLSFATPLSLGVTSDGEYVEIALAEDLSEKELADSLNDVLPEGLKINGAKKLSKKMPTLGSLVQAARFEVFTQSEISSLNVTTFLDKKDVIITRTSKRKTRDINIRPLVFEIKQKSKGLSFLIAQGSEQNLRPSELLTSLDVTNYQLHKNETYFLYGENLVTPFQWLEKTEM
ncbi:TIGR03936 family radical SAM-associated protein [Proteinivorax hydrogeniformans]|uniref:TIGR03936 family radical SAM-associated protein n=1 Tax=Proteinivorax hydrogeniformans TaxID=1826727 RepID=A0AAU8HWK2_9FIRM